MGIRNFNAISVGSATSFQQLAVAAPGVTTMPLMSNGARPKYLLCTAFGGTATNCIFINLRTAATNGDNTTGVPIGCRTPARIILDVHGYSHVGWDEVGDGTTNLQLTPLEDF